MPALDWQGVLTGQPLQWILSGFLTTLWVTLAGIIIASVFAILFLLLRLAGGKTGHAIVSIWVSVFEIRRYWFSYCSGILPRGMGCQRLFAMSSTPITPGLFCRAMSGGLRPSFCALPGVWAFSPLRFSSRRSNLDSMPFQAGNDRPRWHKAFRPGVCFATFCCHKGSLTPGSRLSGNI